MTPQSILVIGDALSELPNATNTRAYDEGIQIENFDVVIIDAEAHNAYEALQRIKEIRRRLPRVIVHHATAICNIQHNGRMQAWKIRTWLCAHFPSAIFVQTDRGTAGAAVASAITNPEVKARAKAA